MSTLNFDNFKKQSLEAGFDEVLERTWTADTVVPEHTHPFSVQAVVTQGEMWMTCHGETRHLTVGGTFEMKQNEFAVVVQRRLNTPCKIFASHEANVFFLRVAAR
jgi:hypothetical protein